MAEEFPEWAVKRACDLLNSEGGYFTYKPEHISRAAAVSAITKLVMKYEEPPVDPVILEARKIYSHAVSTPSLKKRVLEGDFDNNLKTIVAALRRGIELGKTANG